MVRFPPYYLEWSPSDEVVEAASGSSWRGSSTRQLLAIQVENPSRGSTKRIATYQRTKKPTSGSSCVIEPSDIAYLPTLLLYGSGDVTFKCPEAPQRRSHPVSARRRLASGLKGHLEKAKPPLRGGAMMVALGQTLRHDAGVSPRGDQVLSSGKSTYRSSDSGLARASLFLTSCPWITLRTANSTFLPLMV